MDIARLYRCSGAVQSGLYIALSYGVHPISSFRHGQDELITWAEQTEQHTAIYRAHVYCTVLPSSKWAVSDEEWVFAVIAPPTATQAFVRVMASGGEDGHQSAQVWFIGAGQIGMSKEQRDVVIALLQKEEVRVRCIVHGLRRVQVGESEFDLLTTAGQHSEKATEHQVDHHHFSDAYSLTLLTPVSCARRRARHQCHSSDVRSDSDRVCGQLLKCKRVAEHSTAADKEADTEVTKAPG